MFAEDLWLENEKACAVVHKPKRGKKRQELLAVALGVKMGVKGAILWQPLKLFAYSQITSLVRRTALTQHDNHFNYEKAHNFKIYRWALTFARQSLRSLFNERLAAGTTVSCNCTRQTTETQDLSPPASRTEVPSEQMLLQLQALLSANSCAR